MTSLKHKMFVGIWHSLILDGHVNLDTLLLVIAKIIHIVNNSGDAALLNALQLLDEAYLVAEAVVVQANEQGTSLEQSETPRFADSRTGHYIV